MPTNALRTGADQPRFPRVRRLRRQRRATGAGAGCVVESIEPRVLFHIEVAQPIADQVVAVNATPTPIDLSARIFNEEAGPTVRAATTLGNIDIVLWPRQAPLTVQNFLNYVNSGRFNNTIVHRSAFLSAGVPFVIQAGGFVPSGTHITQDAPVQNEFRPNTNNRGTVAMAKPGNNPNGATSEWFVNLRDNNDILDPQNGGFTSFGRVTPEGLAVSDAISALPVVNAADASNGGAWTDLPVLVNPPSTNPPPANEMVQISTTAVIAPAAPVTYTVSTDNPALVNPIVTANSLVVNYLPGQVGRATITVTATESGTGAVVQDSFTVTVGSLDVSIGQGSSAQSIQFTDADGTVANVSVRGGAATLRFSGNSLTQSPLRRTMVVSGTGVEMANLILTGANPGAMIRAAGGDGRLVLNAITADGPVRSVIGRDVILRGTSTFGNGVNRLQFVRSEGATINIRRSGAARLRSASIFIDAAENTKIDSQQPLGTLRLGGWTGTNAAENTISAPAVANMQVSGDFVGGLNLTGSGQAAGRPALGSARITGGVASGTWNVARASRVQIGSVGAGWVGNFADVANFTTTGDLSGTLTANSINVLNAATITNANITLNRAPSAAGPRRSMGLGRLMSRGAIANSVIRAAADIGTVTAAVINGSSIYAGVAGTGRSVLPSSAAEFSSASIIRGVIVRSPAGTPGFINSDIAASALGRISLGAVQVDNGGVPFGLAANSIASLRAIGAGGAVIRSSRLDDPADSVDQADFKVRVF